MTSLRFCSSACRWCACTHTGEGREWGEEDEVADDNDNDDERKGQKHKKKKRALFLEGRRRRHGMDLVSDLFFLACD